MIFLLFPDVNFSFDFGHGLPFYLLFVIYDLLFFIRVNFFIDIFLIFPQTVKKHLTFRLVWVHFVLNELQLTAEIKILIRYISLKCSVISCLSLYTKILLVDFNIEIFVRLDCVFVLSSHEVDAILHSGLDVQVSNVGCALIAALVFLWVFLG